MTVRCIAAAVVVIVLGTSSPVAAQARPPVRPAPRPVTTDRFFISVDGAYRAASEDFSEDVTFRENAESGRFSTDYDVKSGPAFDVSGGALIWRNVGVGVGVTSFSRSVPTAFSASVPHPFFFNRARQVSGDVSGLKREETTVHLQARVRLTQSRRLQTMAFGGPSFFSVNQDVVNDFTITETYPYDEAAFNSGVTRTVSESKIGFNVGTDVGYFFTRQVGVGGTVQWAGTTMDIPASSGTGTFQIKIGGFSAGGGLRLRF
jgi:hypothetical protein